MQIYYTPVIFSVIFILFFFLLLFLLSFLYLLFTLLKFEYLIPQKTTQLSLVILTFIVTFIPIHPLKTLMLLEIY